MEPRHHIVRENNVIKIQGDLYLAGLPSIMTEMYKAIEKCKYEDIVLDFSGLNAAFAEAMVPICAESLRYKKEQNILISCVLPQNLNLNKTFINTNWAHLIDNAFAESVYTGYLQCPTRIVNSDEALGSSVNQILDCVLRATEIQSREDLAVIEWSINEIIENVLRHSKSFYGGLVHLSRFMKNKKCIEIIVVDSGIGIPRSLREAQIHPEMTDYDLIAYATREGITNGLGMGNGLFGAREISKGSRGYFKIYSYYGLYSLYTPPKVEKEILHLSNMGIPFTGTLVSIALDFSTPGLLEKALKFKGEIHRPFSVYTEHVYDEDLLEFIIKDEVQTLSTRTIAEPFRQKVINMYYIQNPQYLIFDCKSDSTMSSSFADELFGKLALKIGKNEFEKKVVFKNLSETNDFVVKRAIYQRIG